MKKRNLAIALVTTGLLFAACGGDDASTDVEPQIVIEGVVTADAASDGDLELAADATEEQQALAFSQCMRDEGIDWPDPVTNADGSIDLFGGVAPGDGAGAQGGLDDNRHDALDVCGSLVEGASFLPDRAGGFDAETQDAFLEFTECLRDNGVEVDDPDFSDLGGDDSTRGPFGGSFDPRDPENADALEACQSLFAGARDR